MRNSLPFVLATVLLTGCHFLDVSNPGTVPDQPSDPATETFASSLGVNIATMQKTTDGVYYSDLTVGTGAMLDSARVVVMDYGIYLKDGTFIAGNTQETIDMSTFTLGLIEGMLGSGATGAGMREGGGRLIVVPSELAYANQSRGAIPPNSTVVYKVVLDQIP